MKRLHVRVLLAHQFVPGHYLPCTCGWAPTSAERAATDEWFAEHQVAMLDDALLDHGELYAGDEAASWALLRLPDASGPLVQVTPGPNPAVIMRASDTLDLADAEALSAALALAVLVGRTR